MKTETNSPPSTDAGLNDPRPRFAICHLGLAAADVGLLGRFYESIGMRSIVQMDRMAILELRGGTHLVISNGDPGTTTLDLMVDDLEDTRQLLEQVGAEPGSITRGNPHNSFTASDPEGNRLLVESSHTSGPV
ncbi:MAG: VOC family protein [Acidobacteria bacterium]|nr:VOC family protein [Acidobacteriota bacterium]